MNRKGIVKRVAIIGLAMLLLGVSLVVGIDWHVQRIGQKHLKTLDTLEPAEAIIILGAYVHPNGQVSRMLKDRLDMGFLVYQAGHAPKIIVSGDHGSKTYNEVIAMATYLENLGVPPEDIFLDHAGFNTYDSLYRMKAVFEVNQAIIVSQTYHVLRANYIGDRLGLSVQGIGADTYVYEGMSYYRLREYGARSKAFLTAGILKPYPRYLGDTISIRGSGLTTRD